MMKAEQAGLIISTVSRSESTLMHVGAVQRRGDTGRFTTGTTRFDIPALRFEAPQQVQLQTVSRSSQGGS